MTEPPAIELADLTVRFNSKLVLDGFSLRLEQGETLIMSGPSGQGKSTVLQCVMGFVAPERGETRIEGRRLDSESVWELRRRLGYVPQEPDLGGGKTRDVLASPFDYKANAHLRNNLERLDDLCERFALPRQLLDEDITSLSGGEKQRVAILIPILLERRIFLLDEATSALDADNKQRVVDFFGEREELSVLAVSHDPQWSEIADRNVRM